VFRKNVQSLLFKVYEIYKVFKCVTVIGAYINYIIRKKQLQYKRVCILIFHIN